MIAFAEEKSETCLAEILAAAPEHDREARPFDEPIDVNVEGYLTLEKLGFLKIVVARDDGNFVGYVLAVLTPSLQYRNEKWATSDGIWLAKDHRRPRVVFRMLNFLEAGLRRCGVVRCVIGAPGEGHPLARVLRFRGYRLRAAYYERSL